MLVTLLGRDILVRDSQSANVPSLISFIPVGMFIVFNALQPWNAYSPIVVTFVGSLIFVKVVQFAKALLSIWVRLTGKLMLLRDLQL